jgi:hypothetical protein
MVAPRNNPRASATIDAVPQTDAIEIETETETEIARARAIDARRVDDFEKPLESNTKKIVQKGINILSVRGRVRTLRSLLFKVTMGGTFEPPLIERFGVCLVQISLATP